MVIKWKENGQMQLESGEDFFQKSQFVGKLYMLSETFSPKDTMVTASFGKVDGEEQTVVAIGTPSIMGGVTRGNLFEWYCPIPLALLEKDGYAAVSFTAQVSVNGVAQVFTSGQFKFYINISLGGGVVPPIGETGLNGITEQLNGVDAKCGKLVTKFKELDNKSLLRENVTASMGKALPPEAQATVNVTKDEETKEVNFEFAIPQGLQVIEGNGVYAMNVEDGNLMLYTQDVKGAKFSLEDDGELYIQLEETKEVNS